MFKILEEHCGHEPNSEDYYLTVAPGRKLTKEQEEHYATFIRLGAKKSKVREQIEKETDRHGTRTMNRKTIKNRKMQNMERKHGNEQNNVTIEHEMEIEKESCN